MRKLKLDELNRVNVQEFKQIDKIPVIIILENIRSLTNIGAIFRTADAFKIEAVHLVGITARPPHREIQKTALGATESVHWEYFENIEESIALIHEKKYLLASIEQTEKSNQLADINDIKADGFGIVMGNEVDGVEQSTINSSDLCIELPQFGTKHSLNVAVCAGIVMYKLLEKFN